MVNLPIMFFTLLGSKLKCQMFRSALTQGELGDWPSFTRRRRPTRDSDSVSPGSPHLLVRAAWAPNSSLQPFIPLVPWPLPWVFSGEPEWEEHSVSRGPCFPIHDWRLISGHTSYSLQLGLSLNVRSSFPPQGLFPGMESSCPYWIIGGISPCMETENLIHAFDHHLSGLWLSSALSIWHLISTREMTQSLDMPCQLQ